MTPSLKISQKVLTRLSTVKNACSGKIYGILARNSVFIIGIQIDTENGSDLINSFPAEVDVRGIISIGDGNYDEHAIQRSLGDVYVTDNPIFLNYDLDSAKAKAYYYINDQLEDTKFISVTEQEILSQFLYLRLQTQVPLTCECTVDAVKEALLNLRKNVASGVVTFRFNKTDIFLLANDDENGVVGVNGNPPVGDIFDDSNEPSEGGVRKKKNQTYDFDVLNVNMFKKVTGENGVVSGKDHAPLCVLDKKNCKTLTMCVSIDALSMLHRQIKVGDLYEIIVESAIRNLRLLENAIVDDLRRLKSKVSLPETFHFYPQDCGHFITKIYLKSDSDDELVSQREKLHKELLLDMLHPQFKRANKFTFKTEKQLNSPLINPHESLKSTDNGGKVALVKGRYSYYHYCQNKMDDNGWGCAYRSLQTLASWFKLQGYTDKDVPTFDEIQKCLVDIGDKPKNFVGSKQWIGSTEVNFVLNTLLGVTSKILYVSSGEEMATKGPELLNHFETQGSPVMIGGGVLAHTILGVDYNSQSGNLRFLILDPHYTGGEDLHTIQSKGWCGWKGTDFWDKTAYYNMCLPQVPVGI